VALYTAASSSERIAFNTLNRKTGNRVKREFVDSETGDPVERDDQVKGYEVENGQHIILDPDEVAAAVPDSDKTLKVDAFIPCNEIDDVYFDKSYYLVPDDGHGCPRAAARRHEKSQSRGDRAYGALPPYAHGTDPAAWQGFDRHHAELRLRGSIIDCGLRGTA
jgi:hypothetical protein